MAYPESAAHSHNDEDETGHGNSLIAHARKSPGNP